KPPYLSAKFSGQQYTIYESNSVGPVVVILHEGPGMLYEDIRFGQIIASNGFKVYMPLMFGSVGERSNANLWRACTRAGFHCFRNKPAAIIDWLRPFVASKSHGKPVAVIGMCLSGNVPAAMLDGSTVRVAVMSQPALPMTQKSALGITVEQANAARAAVQKGAALLYYRFQNDTISPAQRLQAFKTRIPEIEEHQLQPQPDRHGAHSVLAIEYVEDPNDPSNQAVQRIIAVLKERLGS
ncbi:MAG TPA: dienelactone hydrolase family protein, partial [Thermoanaerobaculia bacterium]